MQVSRPDAPLLTVDDLHVSFPVRGSIPRKYNLAVAGVTFELLAGRTMGLVGESGSGKTTLARAVVGLTKPTSGKILLSGTDMASASAAEWRAARRKVQMILQDPYGSLNPRMTARDLVVEAWRAHPGVVPRDRWRAEADALLARVGIRSEQAGRRPRQFSGGQRQRIGIARALALRPELLVCDEPTSALDVSVQAQVLNLILDIQAERQLGVLFISHDLGVVRQVADEMAVMHFGVVVEAGSAEQIFTSPQDEYTKTLLAAVPTLDGIESGHR